MNATAAAMAKMADATIISIRLNPRSLVRSDFRGPYTLSSDPPPDDRRPYLSSLEPYRRQGHALRASQLVPAHRHGHLDAEGASKIGPTDLVQPRRGRTALQLPRDLRLPRGDRVARPGAAHRFCRVGGGRPERRVHGGERQLVEGLHD